MSAEQTLAFIEDYRSHSALWDVEDKNYTNKIIRNYAYTMSAKKYNMTVQCVKNKIKSLRSYFSKEHQKVTQKKSGAGAEDKYDPPWFAYNSMLFIFDSITPRATKDSLSSKRTSTVVTSEENSEDQTEIPDCGDESSKDIQVQSDNGKPQGTNVSRATQSATAQHEHSFAQPPLGTKRKVKRRLDEDDKKEDEAFNFLKVAITELGAKDEITIFGQMVACQLRKPNKRNQAIGKNRIQNCLFDLEMEEMNSARLEQNTSLQSAGVTCYLSSSPSVSSYSMQSPFTVTSPEYSQPSTPQHPENQVEVRNEVRDYLVFDANN